jgi:hypothetical protein
MLTVTGAAIQEPHLAFGELRWNVARE